VDRRRYVLILLVLLLTMLLAAGCTARQQPDIAVEEFPICVGDARQGDPAISGNIVVWLDERNGDSDIYGYNMITRTEFPVCVAPGEQRDPRISGDIIVWEDRSQAGNFDIWGYNLKTSTKFPVCIEKGHQVAPRVSGDLVLWLDGRSEKMANSGYNLETGKEFTVVIPEHPPRQPFELSGKVMVWSYQGGVYGDIYGYNLESGTEFPIATGGYRDFASIGGDTVVWLDSRPTLSLWEEPSKGDLVAYNLTTGEEYRPPRTFAYIFDPVVSGELVVWSDDRNDDCDIYGFDLAAEVEFPVCVSEGRQTNPAVDGNIVVWVDGRNGNRDIYGARISVKN
jgi:TolB protein